MKNLKIGTQLIIGFAIMLFLVIVLGVTSYFQTNEIHSQTETMYNHPLTVRRVLGETKVSIINMRVDIRDLLLIENIETRQRILNDIAENEAKVKKGIEMLEERYLGPRTDIDNFSNEFNTWVTIRAESIRMVSAGRIEEARLRHVPNGVAPKQFEKVLKSLEVISGYSLKKGDELFANSIQLKDTLAIQLVIILAAILLLMIIVYFLLMRNIYKPVSELSDATIRFQNGDLSARTSFVSKNEFGKLSSSFNSLAERIKLKTEIDEKFSDLASLMLSEYDVKKFFQATINALASHTGSQMAAIYLLNEDKNSFEHFESIGVDENARKSFAANHFEGEFGTALSTKNIQHIKNLSEDTRFVFNTVSGKFIPCEIITIPILADNKVTAIVSLASVNKFSFQSVQLIERIHVTLSARIEGILAFHNVSRISKKLELAGNYNRRLIEASIDPLVTIGPDGRITDVNHSTEKATGLSRDKLIGTDFSKYFTEPEKAEAVYQNVFHDGFVHDIELTIQNVNGTNVPVLYNASVYHNDFGEVIGVFAAARDITEQKRAEAELYKLNHELTQKTENLTSANRELNVQKSEMASQSAELLEQNTELEMQKKQLNEASRLKTSFLSNMSHELRTPLNSVIALSSVLNRRLAKQIPDEEYSYLEIIERNGKNLLSLINDILDISRIESGHEEVEITKFNAVNLLSEVISMIKPQAKLKGIDLILSEMGSELMVTNDSNKCRHIFQNIIGNAVKFTEAGNVKVKAAMDDKNIKIVVADTGIGIAEENISHIFDEFRQADGSTSRKFGGTGLGLAIAKKYTNMLGGEISVKSTLGEGSEFIICLPLEYNPENKIIEESDTTEYKYQIKQSFEPLSKESLPKTVLVVEDSEPAIIQIKDVLEESGYKVIVARDGNEALGIIDQTIPDAMILDLMMPGIDGFEILKTIRNEDRTANIPVLILTAKHITKSDLKFLKRNNIHQLIHKGDVNPSELLKAVASMVFLEEEKIEKIVREYTTIKGKLVVLVVEDNPDNMITVKALLAENYIVIEAIDGTQGTALAKEHKPHLILMDIALPKMDGIMAFKQIRKDTELEHIPIIALTASAMTSDREAILAHGFDAYIPKPIDQELFFKTINETLYGK